MLEMPVFKYQWSDSKALHPSWFCSHLLQADPLTSESFSSCHVCLLVPSSQALISLSMRPQTPICVFFFLRSNRGTRSRRLAPLWEWIQVPPLPLDSPSLGFLICYVGTTIVTIIYWELSKMPGTVLRAFSSFIPHSNPRTDILFFFSLLL